MNNNDIINYISTRLSLRSPQRKSLEILDHILPNEIEKMDLEYVKTNYPMITNFHYDFPSLCFALAT
jgi:type III restriction enzyme